MIEIQKIREIYAAYGDTKIIRIALNDAKKIRQEVVPILVEEIQKRNLDERLIQEIEEERFEFSEVEIQQMKTQIENCPCPRCGEKNEQLYGANIHTFISFIIDYVREDNDVVLCESCLNEAKQTSILRTLFFGWWSIEGLLGTPVILLDQMATLFRKRKISDEIIRQIIKDDTKRIRKSQNDKQMLESLLKELNQEAAT